MSESIYEKLPSANSTPTRPKRHKTIRRKSMPILHEHFEPGSMIREIQAHNDTITALDFDVPFGTMVTSALDDTVRVWDLNAGRCIGLLEGHTASVRTLQVEDNILATGSMDATIRLWDLSKARYDPQDNRINKGVDEDEDPLAFGIPRTKNSSRLWGAWQTVHYLLWRLTWTKSLLCTLEGILLSQDRLIRRFGNGILKRDGACRR